MSRFTRALIVSPLADGRTWVLVEPFSYDVGELGSGDTIEVSRGFKTDFASIPRLFWIALPKWGKYGNAAVIHDWLYMTQERSRAEADAILLEGMGVLEVPRWQCFLIFRAVRWFGWFAWMRNRWEREAGYSRIMAQEAFRSVERSDRPGFIHQGLLRWRKRLGR
ncbi:MAG TPA: DUF1353 domain-containing protein [Gammaproteobacteria bacterium]|nr:DUF1353 domain-containing protein [Gammaproteobacteria bacterium]